MDLPPIFLRDDGKPCKLFVEATSVRERPKLVRKIFKHGGHVVNAARDADVVLAENNTKEALELLEAWNGDKIVLSTRWVTSCLQENRFLGADSGWGGLVLTKEGLLEGIRMCGEDVDEEDNYETPSRRQTATHSGARGATPTNPRKDSGPSRVHGSLTKDRRSSKRDRDMEHKPSTSSRITLSETPSEDPLRLHPVTPIDGGPPPMPPPSQANLSQQALMSSMFGSLFQPSPLQQQIPNLFPNTSPGPLHNFLQLQPLPNLQQYNQNQVQLLAQQLLMNPHLLNPQLKESLEQLNLASERLSQSNQAPPPNVNEQQGRPARPTPEDADVDVSDAPSTESAGHSVEYAISPRTNKGKERAGSNHFDRKIEKGIRSKPLASKEMVVSDERGIFTGDRGIPRKFYIMVDLKNRKDLLKIVKKHRGSMVSEMDQADHVILNNRSSQFQPILGMLPVHKVALSPGWLEACDEQDAMADLAPFVIDFTSGVGPGAPRKRPTRRVASMDKVECESEDEVLGRPELSVTTPTPTPTTPTKVQGRRPQRGADSPRSGSRSPSPPATIVKLHRGNSYTEADHEWFFRYARFKLERNPLMSQTALLKAIGRKAPHHSSSSWDNTWRRSWPAEMAALKRDITALAKSAATTLPTPSVASASSAATYSSPFPHSQPLMSTPSSSQNAPRPDIHDLAYPDDDSSPTRSQLDSRPPPSSAPVSSSSTQATPRRSIGTENLKRKEPWEDGLETAVVVDRDGKRIKTGQAVIDVDSFPDT